LPPELFRLSDSCQMIRFSATPVRAAASPSVRSVPQESERLTGVPVAVRWRAEAARRLIASLALSFRKVVVNGFPGVTFGAVWAGQASQRQRLA
jgi:hypothetical protein